MLENDKVLVSKIMNLLEAEHTSISDASSALFKSFMIISIQILKENQTDDLDINKMYVGWKKSIINDMDMSFNRSKIKGMFYTTQKVEVV